MEPERKTSPLEVLKVSLSLLVLIAVLFICGAFVVGTYKYFLPALSGEYDDIPFPDDVPFDAAKWSEEYAPAVSRSFIVMGTNVDMKLWGEYAKEAADASEAELLRLDHLFSLTDADSQISHLNARVDDRLSDDMLIVLKESIRMNELTSGNFDITTYPLSKAWGFTPGDSFRIPSDEEIQELMSHIGMDKFSLTEESDGSARIVFNDEQTMLDVSAIARGYALDRVYEILDSYGIESALVCLGGDILAKGERPYAIPWYYNRTREDHQSFSWIIGIPDPWEPEHNKVFFHAEDEFIITSGSYTHELKKDGTWYGHIIDPKTGRPVDTDNNRVDSVTVVSKSGMEADALATAMCILEKDAAADYWRKCADLDFNMILIGNRERIYATTGILSSTEAVFKSSYRKSGDVVQHIRKYDEE